MNSFVRSLTFYLVAWLCVANFFFFSTSSYSVVEAASKTKARTCIPPVGKLCTYTQVELGTPGTPAANLLSLHFPELYPNGLVIGADVTLNLDNLLTGVLGLVDGILGGLLGNTLNVVLTTVDSVVNFLPQLSSPGCLTNYLLNPTSCPAGSLAGELVTTALNVALDAHVSDANVDLSALVFTQGPCAGLSVAAVINIANAVLGNTCDAQLVSLNAPLTVAATVTECLATINNNFFDGIRADVFLALPGLNLQALVNLNLPVIDVNANVALQLSVPLDVAVRAYLNAQILGITANAALAVNVAYPCFKLDTVDVGLNANVQVTSLAVAVPTKYQGLLGGLLNTVGSLVGGVLGTATLLVDDVLCLVNYLLNFCPAAGVSAIDLQAAILLLLNPSWTFDHLYAYLPALSGQCNEGLVLALVADARVNGVGFVPAGGQLVGVIANLKVATSVGLTATARVLLQVTVPVIDVNVKTNLCIAI